jgi:molecular chaperone GrpE
MTEFKAARTEDDVLGSPAGHEDEQAAKGEPHAGRAAHHAEHHHDPSVPDGSLAGEAPDDPLALDVDVDLETLTAKAAERDAYLALAQRTQADFENYRKRVARELEGAQARGVSRLAGELVTALDNLERALAVATTAADTDAQLIEGLRLVQRELLAALSRAGVERYGEAGEAFDPALHEAVAHQPVEGAPAGAVVEVYQAGYKLAGVVIRPARVLVAA